MAAKIDLSWLAQLLTPTPTADSQANTPDQDPGHEGKFLDSNFQDTTTPYQAPSTWQRAVWPTQAGAVDTLNNQASALPRQENLANQTQLQIRQSNIAKRPMAQQGIYPPDQEAAMGQGDLTQTPSDINRANAATIYGANGGPSLDAAALHNTATQAIEEAKARTLQAATGNALGTPTLNAAVENAGGNTALMSNVARQTAIPSDLTRELAENKLGTAQATGELGLLPSRLSLSGTTLGNQNAAAEQARTDLPFTLATQRTGDIRNLAETERMPIPSQYTDLVDPSTGGITLSKDPLGRNPIAMTFAGMSDIADLAKGKGAQTFIGNDGKPYTVKTSGITTGKPEYPLGAPTIRAAMSSGTTIGGGSNNTTPSVMHDTSGSMAPSVPTASSSTTLTPSLSSSLPLTSTANEGPMTPHIDPEMRAQKQASSGLKAILEKYSPTVAGNIPSYGTVTGEVDPQSALDTISKNASSMSKDDLKQALLLLHQIQ